MEMSDESSLLELDEIDDVADDHLNAGDGLSALGAALSKFWADYEEESEEVKERVISNMMDGLHLFVC